MEKNSRPMNGAERSMVSAEYWNVLPELRLATFGECVRHSYKLEVMLNFKCYWIVTFPMIHQLQYSRMIHLFGHTRWIFHFNMIVWFHHVRHDLIRDCGKLDWRCGKILLAVADVRWAIHAHLHQTNKAFLSSLWAISNDIITLIEHRLDCSTRAAGSQLHIIKPAFWDLLMKFFVWVTCILSPIGRCYSGCKHQHRSKAWIRLVNGNVL